MQLTLTSWSDLPESGRIRAVFEVAKMLLIIKIRDVLAFASFTCLDYVLDKQLI